MGHPQPRIAMSPQDLASTYPAHLARMQSLAERALERGGAYAYVAGEVTMAQSIRTHLTESRGFDPRYIKAAGYWRLGVADAKEDH